MCFVAISMVLSGKVDADLLYRFTQKWLLEFVICLVPRSSLPKSSTQLLSNSVLIHFHVEYINSHAPERELRPIASAIAVNR